MGTIWHSVDWYFRMNVAVLKVVRWRCKIGCSGLLLLDYFVLHLRIGFHVHVDLYLSKYVKK